MLEVALAIPLWFELLATVVYGISGAMSAVKARYDLFGTVCMAVIVGLLGGMLRDILLQDYGIYAFQNPTLIAACALAGLAVFFFGKLVTYFDLAFDLIDALAVGMWAIISVNKGLSANLELVPAIILGTITAVGGGIARDVLMNKEVQAFKPGGTLYGSAALIGSVVFGLMKTNHILENWAAVTCVGIVIVLRLLSEAFDWHTTPPRDYSDAVTQIVAKPAQAIAEKTRPTREVGSFVTYRVKPVKNLDKTGQIGRPLEVRTKPEPKSTKHRDRMIAEEEEGLDDDE